jgi:hypothetical protein
MHIWIKERFRVCAALGSWRLAKSRNRDGCPRCSGWRKLGIPGPSHDGAGHRR